MDGPVLTAHERRILLEIEDGLRTDRRLDRALSTMRRYPRLSVGRPVGRLVRALGRVPGTALAVLLVLSLVLLLAANQVPDGVLGVFAAVWCATAVLFGARLAGHRGQPEE